jgi:hypothetical protein
MLNSNKKRDKHIMKHSEKIQILGTMGEKYVANWLAKEGNLVEHSLFHFDSKKDLVVNDESVEVKCQVPFIKAKAFGVKSSQLRKLKSVDRLFFISIPSPSHKFEYDGWLFEVAPKKFKHNIFVTYDGREMIRIPIYQDAVTPIHELNKTILKEMIKYSTSAF